MDHSIGPLVIPDSSHDDLENKTWKSTFPFPPATPLYSTRGSQPAAVYTGSTESSSPTSNSTAIRLSHCDSFLGRDGDNSWPTDLEAEAATLGDKLLERISEPRLWPARLAEALTFVLLLAMFVCLGIVFRVCLARRNARDDEAHLLGDPRKGRGRDVRT